jgi:hypothetical protein
LENIAVDSLYDVLKKKRHFQLERRRRRRRRRRGGGARKRERERGRERIRKGIRLNDFLTIFHFNKMYNFTRN